jgi:transcription-repair coupling factor (superfamily II helicase)
VQREVELRLGMDLQLPERYLPEPSLRLSFYKRLAACDDDEALSELLEEMADRYGAAPPQVADLANAQRVRTAARSAGVASVARRGGCWRLRLDSATPPSPNFADVVSAWPGAQVSPSGEVVLPITGEHGRLDDVLRFLESIRSSEI